MTHNFDVVQMQKLIEQEIKQSVDINKVHIVFVKVYSDYWEDQQEFVKQFNAVPLDHYAVIHVKFEGLSLSNSGLVNIVSRLIQVQGRSAGTVFVFSPNSIKQDAPWPNIYWHLFSVTDEIIRSRPYTVPPIPVVQQPLTWALFVGRRTMPRLKAVFDCYHDFELRKNCLLSLMNEPVATNDFFWNNDLRYYDNITDWVDTEQQQLFQDWYKNCPIVSIDGYIIEDQYHNVDAGENRNCSPTLSLLGLQDRYLFEMVFETMTRGTTFTPSEKTFRTIVAHKPTLTYAPAGFLFHMRSLGFETFGDIWDESYDQLEGLPRYHAILDIAKSIAVLPLPQQLLLYQTAQTRCQHNYQRLIKFQRFKK